MDFRVVYFRYYVSSFSKELEDTFGFQENICTEGEIRRGGGTSHMLDTMDTCRPFGTL